MLRRLCIAVALFAALSASIVAPASAQSPDAGQAAPAATATTSAASGQDSGISADSTRVAVPPATEQALRYFHTGNVLWIVTTIWGMLLPALILFSGWSARIRTFVTRFTRSWFVTVAAYLAILTLLMWMANLPLSYYIEFVRQHDYGMSNQTFGKWMGDSLTNLAIDLVFTPLVFTGLYLMIRRSGKRWWLYGSLLSIPLLVLMFWAIPVLIDPLFNRFGPMHDKALEARILATAEQAGIGGGRVYEVAKSEDTKAINAYVKGFGSSKRIVLWDTLLGKMNAREVLVVMGHEMGHYVMGHVFQLLLVLSLLVLTSLYAVHGTAGWIMSRYRERIGFEKLSDVASYPLLLTVGAIVAFIVTPLQMAFTRSQEHEADRFALELTRDNHGAATAFVKLQQENLGIPYPGALFTLWRSSHPNLGERIEFANEYRPWETGQPLVYEKHFRR